MKEDCITGKYMSCVENVYIDELNGITALSDSMLMHIGFVMIVLSMNYGLHSVLNRYEEQDLGVKNSLNKKHAVSVMMM